MMCTLPPGLQTFLWLHQRDKGDPFTVPGNKNCYTGRSMYLISNRKNSWLSGVTCNFSPLFFGRQVYTVHICVAPAYRVYMLDVFLVLFSSRCEHVFSLCRITFFFPFSFSLVFLEVEGMGNGAEEITALIMC